MNHVEILKELRKNFTDSFIDFFRAKTSSDDEDDRLIVVRKITKLYGIFGNAAKKLASDR